MTKKKKNKEKNKYTSIFTFILSTTIVLVSVLTYNYYKDDQSEFFSFPMKDISKEKVHEKESTSHKKDFHAKIFELFKEHDVNDDKVLSLEEFEHVILSINSKPLPDFDITESSNDLEIHKTERFDYGEVIELKAKMKSLKLETMREFKENEISGFPKFENAHQYKGLLSWNEVNKAKMEIEAEQLAIFLPIEASYSVGYTYWIFRQSEENNSTSQFFYKQPSAWNNDPAIDVIYKLLQMFHPQPFVYTRFSPGGGAAVVTAVNENYVTIHFRLHCEFQLNKKPEKPFWFTPAQFAGQITISKDGKHVDNFYLYVPNKRKLNVDMEWFVDNNDNLSNSQDSDVISEMEADLGYLPLMTISSDQPSSPLFLVDEDGSVIDRRILKLQGNDVELQFDDVVFNNAIPEERAMKILDKMLNSFKNVEYYPLEEAIERSVAERKHLHHVVLWGSLDDQSC